MEKGLLVIVLISVFGFILLLLINSGARNDETYARKLAKIHVPIHDRHRQRAIPPDKDSDTPAFTEWLLLAAALLLLLMLINAASY